VEANLRESFRVLAPGRPRAEILELPGLSIASLGVAFQMFNAAFLSTAVAGPDELTDRLTAARRFFAATGQQWSFWICEDWLDRPARRNADRVCRSHGLRLASEVPGMIAEEIEPPVLKSGWRAPVHMEFRRVACARTLTDFAGIGTVCFNVPAPWYREVFDASLPERRFVAWVGYVDGFPVATAASVTAEGIVGLYNVATEPGRRGRGLAEATTRHAITQARAEAPDAPVVLQSSSMGMNLYARLGFRAVTRFRVYNS
jgi:ribosomal protein S18 acetylase RimI-like enzyme